MGFFSTVKKLLVGNDAAATPAEALTPPVGFKADDVQTEDAPAGDLTAGDAQARAISGDADQPLAAQAEGTRP
ncbi:MAG: hypothetical protein Q8S17_02115, partial [Humidesulfovibrio sp.]|nr:hypothetical protein [Humidesulfovibrio sp.]